MNCPLCTDTTLNPITRSGVEIDICPTCRGVWLDRNELERLMQTTPNSSASPAPSPQGVAAPGQPGGYPSAPTPKGKKKKSWGARLGEILEEALDA